ncbi:MAG TPA: hypothetical protein VFF94_12880, partial [Novosphingobium sp.]|nr:hypothetical protein [Novosphingobium sp.]
MQQEIQGEIAGGPSAPVNGGTADVLIFAIEAGRYGPARLPQNLDAVGLKVATLCPEDNVLAQTDHAACHYRLPSSRSAPQLARALMAALTRSQARLVIPADEQTVVLLHHFIRGGCAKIIGVEGLAVLVRSLGRPDRLGAMLFKSQTLALARDLGLRVPPGGTAGFAGEALHIADQLGYPVYVKRSFGWSGLGVERCADAAALVAAMGTRP